MRCNNDGKIIEEIEKENGEIWSSKNFDFQDSGDSDKLGENDVDKIDSNENYSTSNYDTNDSKSNDGNDNYFEFEYDDRNNWIIKHEFLNSRRLVNISERKIEYYD